MRNARKQSAADIYHVTSRGVGRHLVFEDDDDRVYYLELLTRLKQEHDVKILAWCLMDNHVHLLLQAPLEQVGMLMRSLGSTYAQHYNRRYDHVGHLFQGRFDSEPIESDEYLLTAIRYVHQNPEKAALSSTASYRWSSYSEYCGQSGICDTSLVLGILGSKKAFEEFHAHDGGLQPKLSAELPLRFADENTLRLYAEQTIGTDELAKLGTLEKGMRNALLIQLREAGLSVRQIERLTGIGRNIIQRATAA